MRRQPIFPVMLMALLAVGTAAGATPANRVAFSRYYGRFLARRLDNCTTCHLPARTDKMPASLSEFPHNPFGDRLRRLGETLSKTGQKTGLAARLLAVAKEDSDGDGVDNQTELLLGHVPGDPKDRPSAQEIAASAERRADFAKFLASYRWEPFLPVRRPAVPRVKNAAWVRNPIDAFIAAEQEAHGLRPRPEAPKAVLLRRVTVDLIGLAPTPAEIRAFENDRSPNAYENVVDRLLADPRYGERWGRHWMDVWRYSDWAGWADGNQIRDSKPFIWRWRDWIVESLNTDKGYDRMVQEMLAADELCPEDPGALRATGFLVRNYKLLSREQWMEDTVGHTARAFLGLTMQCAKCHDHMYDPLAQTEYYRMRAIFEPHNVRTDRVAGQLDTTKDGLVRAYDADVKAATYFFPRGDDRNPDKTRPQTPGVPAALGGTFTVSEIKLPRLAAHPDRRESVIKDVIAASEQAVAEAQKSLAQIQSKPIQSKPAESSNQPSEKPSDKPSDKLSDKPSDNLADKAQEAALMLAVAEARHAALLAVLKAEQCEDAGQKDTEAGKQTAMAACAAQRVQAVKEAELALLLARRTLKEAEAKGGSQGLEIGKPVNGKSPVDLSALNSKVTEAEKALALAQAECAKPPTAAYKPRPTEDYPETSTGRRLAFARWLTETRNPLTARVAVNHIWMRHFGEGIVPSMADFGRNGRQPSHPQLLDWLAAEFMSPRFSPPAPATAPPYPPSLGGRELVPPKLGGQGANSPRLGGRGANSPRLGGRGANSPRLGGRGANSPRLGGRGAKDEIKGWSMKKLHRLIVTSSTYRMASTSDPLCAQKDPDNVFLWRMNSRRLEAEAVRDNMLYVAGDLDATMGGPEIDHNLGLTSKRRSLYLRTAAEKEVEFLKIFDGPSVTECYARKPSVMPQQALALANSELAIAKARLLAETLSKRASADSVRFVGEAFLQVLSRRPTEAEVKACLAFLKTPSTRPTSDKAEGWNQRARENLILVLFNHNDFVTIR